MWRRRISALVSRFDKAVQVWSGVPEVESDPAGEVADELDEALEHRTRIDASMDAIRGTIFTARNAPLSLPHEEAFHYEIILLLLGIIFGMMRGFGFHAWVELGFLAAFILYLEAVNTVVEIEMRGVQADWLQSLRRTGVRKGGMQRFYNSHIGNTMNVVASSVFVGCCAWFSLWLWFVTIRPGGF